MDFLLPYLTPGGENELLLVHRWSDTVKGNMDWWRGGTSSGKKGRRGEVLTEHIAIQPKSDMVSPAQKAVWEECGKEKTWLTCSIAGRRIDSRWSERPPSNRPRRRTTTNRRPGGATPRPKSDGMRRGAGPPPPGDACRKYRTGPPHAQACRTQAQHPSDGHRFPRGAGKTPPRAPTSQLAGRRRAAAPPRYAARKADAPQVQVVDRSGSARLISCRRQSGGATRQPIDVRPIRTIGQTGMKSVGGRRRWPSCRESETKECK